MKPSLTPRAKKIWESIPGNIRLKLLESISIIGFWFKIAAGPSFKPEAYCCMLRI